MKQSRPLENIANETERDAIAMQIFGRSARDSEPTDQRRGRPVERAWRRSEAAGLIMSDEALGDVLELKDGIDKTKEVLKATGTQIGITVTRVILPAFEAFAEKLESVLAWVRSLDERTIKMTLTIAGIVAAIAPALLLLAKVAKAIQAISLLFGALTSPIGLAITAVAALVTAGILLVRNWDKVKEVMLNVWDSIVYGVQQAVCTSEDDDSFICQSYAGRNQCHRKIYSRLSDSIDSARDKLQDLIDAEKESIQYRREAREETKPRQPRSKKLKKRSSG